jgi:hypothetical protein
MTMPRVFLGLTRLTTLLFGDKPAAESLRALLAGWEHEASRLAWNERATVPLPYRGRSERPISSWAYRRAWPCRKTAPPIP